MGLPADLLFRLTGTSLVVVSIIQYPGRLISEQQS